MTAADALIVTEAFDRSLARRKFFHYAMISLFLIATAIVLLPLFGIIGYVAAQGLASITSEFFTEIPKPVGEVGGGVYHALVGSAILVGMASVLGVGWGVAVGVYLSEFGKGRLGKFVRFGTEVLAGIPSILIGLFVYVAVVFPLKQFSAFAGAVALSIIMIPTIARTTEEVLKLVPTSLREAGLGLGISRWKVTIFVILRGSLGGIATGVILAISRAAGETAPLLFTAFGNQFVSYQLNQPIASLPHQIFTFAISPYEDWHAKAWGAALVLMLFVLSLNLFTRFISARLRKA